MDTFDTEFIDDQSGTKAELVVDQLADEGYAILDDFLSPTQVDGLYNELVKQREEDEFKKAGIGKDDQFQINKSIRGDYISWIDIQTQAPFQQQYMSRVKDLMEYINRSCFLGLKDFEIHFAFYPEGTFYKRHSDRFNDHSVRTISLVCYLNKAWSAKDGGQLVLYPEGRAEVSVLPKGGRLVCFLSGIEHEVLLSKKTRYSVTGWLLNQHKDLNFLP